MMVGEGVLVGVVRGRGRWLGGVPLLEGGSLARLEAVLERHAVVVVVQALEGLEDFLVVTLAMKKIKIKVESREKGYGNKNLKSKVI